jgi:hypothetical protein
MPVMLLFRHGDTITFSIIRRRIHKRDESKDVLEKVTLIKDIRFSNPHRAHIDILHDLSFSELFEAHRVANFVQLQDAWQKTLDSSELNRRFYQELANWYFWALDHVRFPEDAPRDMDGHDSLSLIRLITRVIFCWFLREKGLIPESLFRERDVRSLLGSLEEKENTYYTAVLQNLFFATLNTEMDELGKPPSRHFIGSNGDAKVSEDHMIHTLWRYKDRIKDTKRFEQLMRTIPFLNGGLFECLDERVEQGNSRYTREVRVDGFSVKSEKQPRIPNFLFFGADRRADLSQAYGEIRYREAMVRPLIPLLEHYKFTVAENTPIEEEVALDPELLGQVFENLLAAYNPETDKVARKTTGSFYTPRTVVDFMVDESLVAHLETALKSAIKKEASPFEPRLRQLIGYTEELHQFTKEEARILVEAIDRVKILDPACGSGAFPMGALHKLAFLLRKLDPGNASWKERQLAKAQQLDVGREAAIAAIEETFARDAGDYARKLYLIENCLYGVDIQPIAVQIAKLRCFISLVVEQQMDESLSNRGILPLPNLETNFVTANTLMGLHRADQMMLPAQNVEEKQSEIRRVRHQHFLARRYSEKKGVRKREKELRKELAQMLRSSRIFPAPEAELVANWDPYHPDRAAAFFDPEWMFNLDPARRRRAPVTLAGHFSFINEVRGQGDLVATETIPGGFDIVIGNPPYVRQEELKHMKVFEETSEERPLKDALKTDYFCYTGVADLYVYFYEKSLDLLKVGGVLCFISSNKYFRSGYGERLRHFLSTNAEVRLVIDFGDTPIFTSIAYPSIVLLKKIHETRDKSRLVSVPKDKKKIQQTDLTNEARALNWEPGPPIEEFPEIFIKQSFDMPQKELTSDGWRLESSVKLKLLERIRAAGVPLGEYVKGRFYYGIKTGLNEAFVVDRTTRDRLIAEHPSSAEILKPFLRGRDVKRWRVEFAEQYLIKIESSENKKHAWSNKSMEQAEKIFGRAYPAIYQHLQLFRQKLIERYDQGKYFWELRSCDYWTEFRQPKVVFTRFVNKPVFAYEDNGYYLNNALWIIPRVSPVLVPLLNSPICWWFLKQNATDLQSGYLQISRENLAPLGVPLLPSKSEESICQIEYYLRLSSGVSEGKEKAKDFNLLIFEYLETLLNSLTYELFFPDDLHSHKINLFKHIEEARLPVLADIPEKQRLSRLEEIYERISNDRHPIRGCLESLKSLEVVRIIEGRE